MRMQFKSAATTLVLCLVFQAQAETLLGSPQKTEKIVR